MGKRIALLAGAAVGLTAGAQGQTLDNSRAYSAEVLSQAQSHTSTLAQPAAGDVTVGGQIQFRWIFNSRDDNTLVEDTTTGFQTTRTKLWATGNVNEEFGYRVQGAFDRDGGTFGLEDAFVTYKVNDQSTLQWGQFKLPLLREELVSSAKQLAAERSVMNETFNQDRSQGVQWGYAGENFRFWAAFSDGVRTANTDFDSDSEADYGFTGRFEYMWSGDWKQFEDFTSWKGSAYAGMLGAAAHWQSGGNTFATGGTTDDEDLLMFTVDASAEGDGWNAFAAFVYTSFSPAVGADRDDMGFVVQGGYAFNDNWEVFGRYDVVIPEDPSAAPEDDFSSVTFGVNYYVIPQSHAAKFTADVAYFIDNPVTSVIVPTSTGTGLLGTAEDGQWALRFQFQVLF